MKKLKFVLKSECGVPKNVINCSGGGLELVKVSFVAADRDWFCAHDEGELKF